MKATKSITIPAIEIKHITLKLVGTTPLIEHRWTDEAKRMILENEMKKAKTKSHKIKNPIADFIDALYWITQEPEEKTEEAFAKAIKNGARFGFPTVGFKASAVAAGYRAGITKDRVSTNGAFHIDGEMAEIHGSIPKMREDMVRVGMGKADIRYRGEFKNWWTELNIRYNSAAITDEQIANLFNLGGFACGIGEWRPERGGKNGMYKVA